MTGNELRNQELNRHEEELNRNIEHQQDLNLHEKQRNIVSASQNASTARFIHIVYYVFGALELLLATRLILRLVSVNADNAFATFIYGLSTPFVALFASLLQNPTVTGTMVLEITIIIAMLVWAIVAWLIGQLIWLVLSPLNVINKRFTNTF